LGVRGVLGLRVVNPATGLRLGRLEGAAPPRPGRALNEAEVISLLSKVPDPYRPLVELLVQTGLSVSEAQALTKEDVDFERRRIRITKRLYKPGLDSPSRRTACARSRSIRASPYVSRDGWRFRPRKRCYFRLPGRPD
jgi:integrase